MDRISCTIIVLLVLTAPLTATVNPIDTQTDEDTGPASWDGSAAASRGETAPTGEIDVSVENTLGITRPDEVIRLSIPFGIDELTDLDLIKVVDIATQQEVLGGALPSTAEFYPNGSIRRVDFTFQDDFASLQKKDYKIIIGESASLSGDMNVNTGTTTASIFDGSKHYQVSGSQTGSGSAYVRCDNSSGDAYAYYLTRLGGNQMTPDQVQFSLYWGSPVLVEADHNDVMVTVHMVYNASNAVYWGGPNKKSDILTADVTLNFYNDRDLVEIIATKTIGEKIFNHNGFVDEFTAIQAGDDVYEIMFGNERHTTMRADSSSLTWLKNTTVMSGIDAGWRGAPALADLDGDGDLDLALGEENGTLAGFWNTGNSTDPAWTYDAAIFGAIDVGTHSVPEFADVNGDGLIDLVIGRGDGTIRYYRNSGTVASPSWNVNNVVFTGIDVGDYSAPALDDLDGDGDLDLLIGESGGGLVYYNNTGTTANPVWTLDTLTFANLNSGATRKPETFSDPDLGDLDFDGDLDLLSGVEAGKFGASVFYFNTGNTVSPKMDLLFPGWFNNVRGGDFTHPEMADLDDDGDLDLLMGREDGTVDLYWNDDNASAESNGANMQPLDNGSYRFFYDQDRNDGQYVIVDEAQEFYDYYVISSPSAQRSVMRYIPDFDRLTYKDRYYGDAYPSAGGNVSYYPFIPEEDGYITRGLLSFGAYSVGANSATFFTQTGTAGGFVQVPITAMEYTTREVLLDETPYGMPTSYYDDLAKILATPLKVTSPVDLTVHGDTVSIEPNKADGDTAALTATVENIGGSEAYNVPFAFYSAETLLEDEELCSDTLATVPGFGTVEASCQWDTTGWGGERQVFVWVDDDNSTKELDEFNNVGNLTIYVPFFSRDLSPIMQVTSATENDLAPDIVVDSTGTPWAAWSTYRGKEDFDVGVSSFDGSSWSQAEWISEGRHWSVDPALAADLSGNVYLVYSNNEAEYIEYLANESSRNYWNTKFDVYSARYDGSSWSASTQVTDAFGFNATDQAPDVSVTDDGEVITVFRNTRFRLYYNGNQIDNQPYSELNIRGKTANLGSGWDVFNMTFDDSSGSEGLWRGPAVASAGIHTWVVWDSEESFGWDIKAKYYSAGAGGGTVQDVPVPAGAKNIRPDVAVSSNGSAWFVYESDDSDNKDIYVAYYDKVQDSWSGPFQLTSDLASDMKPVVTVDSIGNPWVAWESFRNGNKDVYMSHFNGLFWSRPFPITDDAGSDEEPAVTAGPAGVVWVAWESDRNGHGNKDILARRITSGIVAPVITATTVSPLSAVEDEYVTFMGSATDSDGAIAQYEWDLDGDGIYEWSSSQGGTATRTFPQQGTYVSRFRVTDDSGLSDEGGWLSVDVANLPPVPVTGPDRLVPEDSVVSFNGTASYDTPSDLALGLEYMWDFGDGNSTTWSHNGTARHTYISYGYYEVTLYVRDVDLDVANSTLNITVYNLPPMANITIGNLTGLEDEVLTFSGHGNDTPSDSPDVNWRWVFGDGTFSDWSRETTVTHVYKDMGNYTAMLIVRDGDNATANGSISVDITNLNPIILDVIGPVDDVDEDANTSFTATATDTVSDLAEGLEYRWDWGEGNTSNWSSSPDEWYTFVTEGEKVVSVVVRDNNGATATEVVIVDVVNPAPTALIDPAVRTRVNEDEILVLAGSGEDTASDIGNLTFEWDLGDGTTAQGSALNHTYCNTRSYIVTLTVTDGEGAQGTDTATIVVANVAPTAKASADATSIKVGEDVSFTAEGSSDTVSDIADLKYTWSFDDGGSGSGMNVSHSFIKAGTFRVTLTVTDDDGDTDTAQVSISVTKKKTDGAEEEGGIDMLLIGGVIALVVIILAILLFLRSRKPSAAPSKEEAEEEEEEAEKEEEEEAEKEEEEEAEEEEEEAEEEEEEAEKEEEEEAEEEEDAEKKEVEENAEDVQEGDGNDGEDIDDFLDDILKDGK